MKAKDSIVCVAMTTWEGDYVKAVVKLMEALSGQTRVLFVNYQFTWKDVIWALIGRGNAPWRQMLGLKSRVSIKSNVTVLTPPPILPINWIRSTKLHMFLNQINGWIIARSIQKTMKSIAMENPIMVNAFNPVLGYALKGRIATKHTYYYCYDEISQSEWCKEHGPAYETSFISMVEGVFTSSRSLQNRFETVHSNVAWIPNGVDFELFSKAYHDTLQGNNIKRVVFVGSLDFRVDIDLISHMAEALPEVQFDLVGRVNDKKGVENLSKLLNVNIYGSRSPEELPTFLSEADLGVIPFVKNDFTKSIYPMKINEYMAAGLPVVATDFADLSEFRELIEIASNKEDFLDKMKITLNKKESAERKRRYDVAKGNDWAGRATMFWDFHDKNIKEL